MRDSLRRWIADADTRYSMRDFGLESRLDALDYLDFRSTDLYFSLVGELFDLLRSPLEDRRIWSTLGNALASVSRDFEGSTRAEALFFSAAAFYRGGFPASAVITMRRTNASDWTAEIYRASYDLLNRRGEPASEMVRSLLTAMRSGDTQFVDQAAVDAEEKAQEALLIGPDEWIAHRLYASLLSQFRQFNLRAALPDGSNSRWDPLVKSFLSRRQPVWEFFPSQIEAIQAGLFTSDASYSLQMPTGAGKTALTETLLYNHLADSPQDKAVLLVPYRALARELRYSLGRNLTDMGIHTRSVYGGTVPSVEEGEDLDSARVVIATPEALTGLIGAQPEVASSVSLVVCDEGHLLASESRGVGLELLLARLRSRESSPRIVFISAIVPNVEEINAWLGGSDSTVVKSDYRPALAEYAVLRPVGSGQRLKVGLELQELSTTVPAHTLPNFLQVSDFKFTNPATKRLNTYGFDSKKTQAIAVARKSLPLGTVAVFAATKTGPQGVISLADELIAQLDAGIHLPMPTRYLGDPSVVDDVVQYLAYEYGADWTVTRALSFGAVVHHGDLPQETRETLEELLTRREVSMVLCTSTLAEGVNLPIRTLVLYSVRRGSKDGPPTPMLARDIKNLVGRAGRAGSSTRGLVVCVNPDQWRDVKPVAAGEPGEPVEGALIDLLRRLEQAIVVNDRQITNHALENTVPLMPLVDGIDATLIELIHDELGPDEFMRIAESLAADTFAAQKADTQQRSLLNRVFQLRASRLLDLRSAGRLSWARETGGRPRLVDSVIDSLYPRFADWTTVESSLDGAFLEAVLGWAQEQPGFAEAADAAYDKSDVTDVSSSLFELVTAWIEGRTFVEMAEITGLRMDRLLHIHTKVVLYDLTTLVEQALALLQQYLSSYNGESLSPSAAALADCLRYGVPSSAARELLARGLRHRRAAVELGAAEEMTTVSIDLFSSSWSVARELLEDRDTWLPKLGAMVYQRSVRDVAVRRLGQ